MLAALSKLFPSFGVVKKKKEEFLQQQTGKKREYTQLFAYTAFHVHRMIMRTLVSFSDASVKQPFEVFIFSGSNLALKCLRNDDFEMIFKKVKKEIEEKYLSVFLHLRGSI